MAGESSTVAIEARNHPHEFETTTFGPFSHAAGSGAVALGSNVNVPIGHVFDRDNVIDSVSGITETGATVSRAVRLYYATSGQTMAAAVSANQYITASTELWSDTNPASTVFNFTVDRTNNFVPADSRLFLNVSTTLDTSLVGFRIRIRRRTLIR